MADEQGQTRGVEATADIHDEAAVWMAPGQAERDRKLAELQKRYAWFGEKLSAAHDEGKIASRHVRWFIMQRQPLLDEDGELQTDWEAEPIYFGRVQAWSYVGDPPSQTVAGTMDVALQLLDRGWSAAVMAVICADLNALHARELAAATQ
jgi:hypothetical protein